MNKFVTPSKGLGFSDFYLDFVNERPEARQYFKAPSIEAAHKALSHTQYDREALAEILVKQNRSYGVDDIAMANIELLRSENALCVFAGQQAGLFSGPLLVLIKAIGIVKAARLYSKQLNQPVIPIFWIAGDDHDFEEANHTFVVNHKGEIEQLTYRTPPENPVPASDIILDDATELERVKNQLQLILGQTDFTNDLYTLLDKCYAPGETLVSAFGKFMAALTVNTGLVLFSPGDDKVKQLVRPFLKQIILKQAEIHNIIDSTNKNLKSAGYHTQVEKAEKSTYLFCNIEGRQPILRNNDAFSIGSEPFSTDEILTLIDKHPEKFSPDVLTRPVFQSYLFPTLSQQGGPAEIAYLAQMNQLFELFDLPAPYHRARPTATIIEKRSAKMLNDSQIEFSELSGDVEQIINRVLSATFPTDVEKGFADLRHDIESRLNNFIGKAFTSDKGLKKYGEQIQGKIDFTIMNLEKKTFAAHKKKSSDTRSRIYRLYNTLYTCRGLQERAMNVTYYLSKYGRGFITILMEQIDSETTDHQLIDLTEKNI